MLIERKHKRKVAAERSLSLSDAANPVYKPPRYLCLLGSGGPGTAQLRMNALILF